MKVAPISRGGQVSLPADIRHRWKAKRAAAQAEGHPIIALLDSQGRQPT